MFPNKNLVVISDVWVCGITKYPNVYRNMWNFSFPHTHQWWLQCSVVIGHRGMPCDLGIGTLFHLMRCKQRNLCVAFSQATPSAQCCPCSTNPGQEGLVYAQIVLDSGGRCCDCCGGAGCGGTPSWPCAKGVPPVCHRPARVEVPQRQRARKRVGEREEKARATGVERDGEMEKNRGSGREIMKKSGM